MQPDGECVRPEGARAVVARQKEHHKTQDFKAEFLELLRLNEIEFDEREVFE
jgi:hypothetical protein